MSRLLYLILTLCTSIGWASDLLEVTVENKEIELKGTLTLPSHAGKVPAAILIAGSGPMTRDQEVCGHQTFKVLAEHLTQNGIAVLRLDKRGCGESTGDYTNATTLDFASDVQAAIEFLKSVNKVDASRIGLIGHSEGGLIAPMVAAPRRDMAFVVLLAAPAVSGEEILKKQGRLVRRALGMDHQMVMQHEALLTSLIRVATGDESEEKLPGIFKKFEPLASEEDLRLQYAALTSPWFKFFLSYDPVAALRELKIPTLVLNGDKDLQVDPDQNLPIIKAALTRGFNDDFEIVRLPSVNHIFQTCETGSVTEYSEIEESFSPLALETISTWISKRTMRP